jgi:hypothetical protein
MDMEEGGDDWLIAEEEGKTLSTESIFGVFLARRRNQRSCWRKFQKGDNEIYLMILNQ